MNVQTMTDAVASFVIWLVWLGGVGLLTLGMALAAQTVFYGYRAGSRRIVDRHDLPPYFHDKADPEPEVKAAPEAQPRPSSSGYGVPKIGGRDAG